MFAVLMFFDAVNKISIYGVAVISNLTVYHVCVFHAAVFRECNYFFLPSPPPYIISSL